MPAPGRTLTQLPVRNLLRAPRRTVTTVFAVAGVLTAVIALAGMVDSFRATIDAAEQEITTGASERMQVQLDAFYPRTSPQVAAIASASSVGRAEPHLSVAAELRAGGTTIDAAVDLLDPAARLWRPALVAGTFPRGSTGIVLSEKAARDLGIGVGDPVVLRHPLRTGATVFRTAETRLRVAGLHRNPSRPLAYMGAGGASLLGLQGAANAIALVPTPESSPAEVERDLARLRGVVSSALVTETIDALDRTVDSFVGIIRVAELGAFVLTVLIAFNATSISAEERRRDHATMFAFGLPVRSVLRIGVVEGLLIGALGTVLGIATGTVVLRWIVHTLVPRSFPEIGVIPALAPGTYAVAAIVGAAAFAVAPLLTVRRLLNMDIPSTLRVVE